MKPEDWDKFLINIADTYQVKGKPRKVFLERFDYKNWGKSDTEIKNISQVPSIETYKKHANTIYKQFSKDKPNGCPKLDPSDPGAGKFEILRTWLQEAIYPQWLAEQQPEVSSPSLADINWREVCGKVLAQQRENQRLRRQATERGFELNVYVPLGLVDRKQQQRRRGDVPLEEVYQLTEEVITKEYDNDKFLTEVIEPGKSRRIAIIGEPGAGKTTLQEKIAVWIHDNNKCLPICIPLGGLQGKSLEDYLLQIWLKTALRFIEPEASGVEARHIASLQKQFREGKVWLLLDGVDEMAATSPVEALATIKEQLTDWLVEARVVLTCRLNVWDAKVNNTLSGFETYRTLEFKPEQVEKFIRDWFACAKEWQRGEELLRKLQETGKERIRELVRNPLRLSLLCQTSYVLPVDEPLPETKAALYERFTRYFYEWKQEQHPTAQTERRQLNQALGELAKAGINSKARFRLGEDLACDVMGEPLFDLACRLGWLNLVDREAKTDEAVYAFFHPTFQEYFAACAIDDWRYFLNHDNENPNPLINPNPSLEYDNGKPAYRIFEPHWKEVILLWFGREGDKDFEKQKNMFVETLIKFEDGCEDFYRYRAYFLAAMGIAEFGDCRYADEIVEQVIKWKFGAVNIENSNLRASALITKGAKAALLDTHHEKVIDTLTRRLNSSQSEGNSLEIALTLIQKAPGNPVAVKIIVDYLDKTQESLKRSKIINLQRIQVMNHLEKFGASNPVAIAALAKLLPNRQQNKPIPSLFDFSCFNLPTEPNDLQLLNLMAETDTDITTLEKSIGTLNYINTLVGMLGRKLTLKTDIKELDNLKALIDFINRLDSKQSELIARFITSINFLARNRFIEIASGDSTAVSTLVEMLCTSDDRDISQGIVMVLGEAASRHIDATKAVIQLLQTTQDEIIAEDTIYFLKKIIKSDLLKVVIEALKDYIEQAEVYEIICHCAQNMPYPDFYQAWHQTIIHERG